ncbi:hypothetical protein HHI36_018003, partial [Cryptolaemus montrouzieri]
VGWVVDEINDANVAAEDIFLKTNSNFGKVRPVAVRHTIDSLKHLQANFYGLAVVLLKIIDPFNHLLVKRIRDGVLPDQNNGEVNEVVNYRLIFIVSIFS